MDIILGLVGIGPLTTTVRGAAVQTILTIQQRRPCYTQKFPRATLNTCQTFSVQQHIDEARGNGVAVRAKMLMNRY
ncbi:hypothetical protein BDW75DRAFT_41519 [Aspergillus navahoensis]